MTVRDMTTEFPGLTSFHKRLKRMMDSLELKYTQIKQEIK